MPRTAAAGEGDAVGAQELAGKLQRVKAAAAFALGVFRGSGRFGRVA